MKKTARGIEYKKKLIEHKPEIQETKKEFKIEIVKVGKLEDKTAGGKCDCFSCECGCTGPAPSDINIKENFSDINRLDILSKLLKVAVREWNYKYQSPDIRHIGPMAQDFAASFSVGEDDKHINMIDAFGVTLASIQALHQMVVERDDKIRELEEKVIQLNKFFN